MVETHIKHKKIIISVLSCAPLFPRNSSCISASNKCTTKADTWLRRAAQRGGVNWLLMHYSRLPRAPDHEGAGRPQGRDQHEGPGPSQRAGGGVKTRGCQVNDSSEGLMNARPQKTPHAATQSFKKQKHPRRGPTQPQGEEGYGAPAPQLCGYGGQEVAQGGGERQLRSEKHKTTRRAYTRARVGRDVAVERLVCHGFERLRRPPQRERLL